MTRPLKTREHLLYLVDSQTKWAVKYVGMEAVLIALIDSVCFATKPTEPYLTQLQLDLTNALVNYKNRYAKRPRTPKGRTPKASPRVSKARKST